MKVHKKHQFNLRIIFLFYFFITNVRFYEPLGELDVQERGNEYGEIQVKHLAVSIFYVKYPTNFIRRGLIC